MVIAFHAVSRGILCSLALGLALLACRHERQRVLAPEVPCSAWGSERGECTGSIEITDLPDPLMVLVQFDYRWAGENAASIEPARWKWDVPREQLDELRASARPRVPCELQFPLHPTSTVSCKTVLMQPNAVKDPEVPLKAREQICPQRLAAPLNPEIADLDPVGVAATFPAEHGAWRRTALEPYPADAEVKARYTKGAQQVQISVRDMIHECTGEDAPNTMLATEHKAGKLAIPRRMMSATSAVLLQPVYGSRDRPRQLVMWIAGRCRITVVGITGTHTDDDFAAAGQVIDVAALQPLCTARARR